MQTGDAPSRADEPWVRLEPAHSWKDLVLPEQARAQLQAIPAEFRRRGEGPGLRLLFLGERGTGKTMAARLIGAEVREPIFEVNLVEELRGEKEDVEQLLARIFDAAERSNAVVLFDGAGALLGSRGRAGDRSPPLDISQLLDRARQYAGIVILASRLTRPIPEALAGRFDFVVEFPFPATKARVQLWRRLLPADARVSESDIEFLAASFRLPGASIASCCLVAGQLAKEDAGAVELRHVAHALEDEYRNWVLGDQTRTALAQLRAASGPDQVRGRAPVPRVPVASLAGVPAATVRLDAPVAAAKPASSPAPASGALAAPAVAATAARSAPRRGRPRLLALALGGMLAAVALGFVAARALNHGGGAQQSTRLATAGSVEVSFPSSWHRTSAPSAVPVALTDGLALAPDRGQHGALAIGSTHGATAGLLPAGASGASTPGVVTLGGTRFYRYVDWPAPGDSTYTLATTGGTVAGFCIASGAPPGFKSDCERVLATIRLLSGSLLPLGTSSSYAVALSRIIGTLNSVRSSAGRQLLAAHTAQAQAKAAGELASAHANAAAAVVRLDAGSAGSANSTLTKALGSLAGAYDALARAASRHDVAGYKRAAASVSVAEKALSAAFAELARLGYRVG